MSCENFAIGALSTSFYFCSNERTTKAEKKENIRHNILTGLTYLPLIGAITSLVESILIYKVVKEEENELKVAKQILPAYKKENNKELAAFRAGLFTCVTVRIVLSTFTGPFILPFIDLFITKMSNQKK